jgi:carboxylate-amine ligase
VESAPYELDDAWDEAFTAAGAPRDAARASLAALARHEPGELAAAVCGAVANVGFSSLDGDGDFHLDPVPRAIAAAEWAELEAGLSQRVRALDAFLADAYGRQSIVAEGVMPARVIETCENWEPALCGLRVPGDRRVGVAGLDVVRTPEGELRVLEDNLTTPSGMAYAVAAREATLAQLAVAPEDEPRELGTLWRTLAWTFAGAAPEGAASPPRVVVLTDGPDNSAHWEHARIAERLGAELAEPGDLEPAGDRLRLAGRDVDVVYRRTNEHHFASHVGELLGPALRAGTLGVLNAFGTAVADDKLAHAYVEEMVRFYLGEEPLVRSVRTYDLGRADALEEALDRLEELVVKPRAGYGGIGVLIAPHAERADVERMRERLRTEPGEYVAQELVALSRHPTVVDGRIVPRHVDLRPFVFLGPGREARVLPGGLTRVAFDEGALVVNSSQNGGVKDTWVVA